MGDRLVRQPAEVAERESVGPHPRLRKAKVGRGKKGRPRPLDSVTSSLYIYQM